MEESRESKPMNNKRPVNTYTAQHEKYNRIMDLSYENINWTPITIANDSK